MIAGIAVLMAILMPALQRAREHGKRAYCLSFGSWTVYYDEERWWDPVPLRHGKGTTFSFADGHAEDLRWMDARTIDMAERTWKTNPVTGFTEKHPNNEDLRWVQRGVWGTLGYEP